MRLQSDMRRDELRNGSDMSLRVRNHSHTRLPELSLSLSLCVCAERGTICLLTLENETKTSSKIHAERHTRQRCDTESMSTRVDLLLCSSFCDKKKGQEGRANDPHTWLTSVRVRRHNHPEKADSILRKRQKNSRKTRDVLARQTI